MEVEVTREDLSQWDSGARSWLQSADAFKLRQHKQLELIINNASLAVNSDVDTYQSVMSAWKDALVATDNLLRGVPQRVQNGASLLAISSWHLYPEMLVFQGNIPHDVRQGNGLFSSSAILTLGLELQGQQGVSWSLPLHRLQYYGQPVETSGFIGHGNPRLSAVDFSVVVLGCVLTRSES